LHEEERRIESDWDMQDRILRPETRTNVDFVWDSKEQIFHEITLPFLNAITRDITTSHLEDFEKQRCFYLLVLINNCVRDFVTYNHNTKDDVLWFLSILGSHTALSKGTHAALLRILKTQYSVSSETKNEGYSLRDEDPNVKKDPNVIDVAKQRLERGARRMQ
jgi:hypothetical protein